MTVRPTPSPSRDWKSETARLYKRDERYVYKFALTLLRGRAADAEDVTNETFFKAFHLYGLDIVDWPEKRTHATLRTIAQNLVTDMWRAEQKLNGGVVPLEDHLDIVAAMSAPESENLTPTVESGAEAPDGSSDDRANTAPGQDMIAVFWDAVASSKRLTDREYRVAYLTWGTYQSADRIAKELNTTRQTVHTMRSRAKGKIRALAKNRGLKITFTDEVLAQPDEHDALSEGDATA